MFILRMNWNKLIVKRKVFESSKKRNCIYKYNIIFVVM